MFEYNVAFTVPINDKTSEIKLTPAELWLGIKRTAHRPQDFVPYVRSCTVIDGDAKSKFRRRLVMGNGAVHKSDGEEMIQDVIIKENLLVEATTVDTGATSTALMSSTAMEASSCDDEGAGLLFTALYGLRLDDVEDGSDQAEQIKAQYSTLARNTCMSVRNEVRMWKKEGTLDYEE